MIWFDTKPVLILAAGFLLYESPGAGWLSGAGSGGKVVVLVQDAELHWLHM